MSSPAAPASWFAAAHGWPVGRTARHNASPAKSQAAPQKIRAMVSLPPTGEAPDPAPVEPNRLRWNHRAMLHAGRMR
ncbi:hypothetical protein ACT3S2_02185 [Arthrobacter sp. AOP36-A1-22]|uniref:hypothetical protein n=1 Tax=unclassified Arthrobacter TaxID=235627 RepID=UPI002655CE6A|nr:hypothetical protein [Micrococcaceae bacterium]MDN5878353.1 hypothetical protein [Micrococcaceae bacterium]MDN5885932.1 hypothetical protein [Micrococcaceae bacterium]